MGFDSIRVLPHHVAHLVGDLSHRHLIFPDDSKLYRIAHGRSEIEAIHPHACGRQCSLRDSPLYPGLDTLAGFCVVCHDHDFGEGFVQEVGG